MAAISLKEAEKHLKIWLMAELEIATSQSYKIGTRSLTRADLKEVRNQIEYWQKKIAEIESVKSRGGRNRVMRAIPRDI
ncbi:hypothetical protein FACS1894111_05810 [Clostridia bacterium]|nr:hypothetical protein FACS1894111_05810 [Clostridia bacterium]